jgi:hypothetical protein
MITEHKAIIETAGIFDWLGFLISKLANYEDITEVLI